MPLLLRVTYRDLGQNKLAIEELKEAVKT